MVTYGLVISVGQTLWRMSLFTILMINETQEGGMPMYINLIIKLAKMISIITDFIKDFFNVTNYFTIDILPLGIGVE